MSPEEFILGLINIAFNNVQSHENCFSKKMVDYAYEITLKLTDHIISKVERYDSHIVIREASKRINELASTEVSKNPKIVVKLLMEYGYVLGYTKRLEEEEK